MVGPPNSVIRITSVKLDNGGFFSGTYTTRDGGCSAQHITDASGLVVLDGGLLNDEHQLITLAARKLSTVQFQNYPKPTLIISKVDINGQLF